MLKYLSKMKYLNKKLFIFNIFLFQMTNIIYMYNKKNIQMVVKETIKNNINIYFTKLQEYTLATNFFI